MGCGCFWSYRPDGPNWAHGCSWPNRSYGFSGSYGFSWPHGADRPYGYGCNYCRWHNHNQPGRRQRSSFKQRLSQRSSI